MTSPGVRRRACRAALDVLRWPKSRHAVLLLARAAVAAPEPSPRRRDLLGSSAVALIGACTCALCCEAPAAHAGLDITCPAASAGWGSGSEADAFEWGVDCSSGRNQSPVDLPVAQRRLQAAAGPRAALRVEPQFRSTPWCRITNGGRGTMQVNLPRGACTLTLERQRYELLQFHFHLPAEHALDARRAAMEAHLVHRNETPGGGLAVIAVMLQPQSGAAPLTALRRAVALAPAPGREVCSAATTFDPTELLPLPLRQHRPSPFAQYNGSLTTPPCSEGVTWIVFTEPVDVAQADVDAFADWQSRTCMPPNARPLQPLSDRSWTLYDGF